ncbi:MAG: O-succinylhomoserine sulfhydrylase [Gammaproteobacteria bacterium]
MTDEEDYDFATRAVRFGQTRSMEQEHAEPIYTTSSFVFKNAAEAAACFSGKRKGNLYSRFTNPTVKIFEQRLASLEGGEACVATASGMAAIYATCAALLSHGDHIVASRSIFGSTTMLFTKYLSRFGIDTTFVNPENIEECEHAFQKNTRMLFVETPSNPLTSITDIALMSGLAHANSSLLVVDNCFCTPVLQRPLELGADIVIHSATKYLDGQGRCLGGAVVGNAKTVGEEIFGFLRTCGPTMSPFNAWVFLKGLETLAVRMKAHCESANTLAHWLTEQEQVSRVYYPGLTDHPQHELAKKQQSDFGGIVSFEVEGGQPAAWQLIDATRICSITANLGDTRTTITHPATTTHGRLSDEQKQDAGISDALIRVSVGLESIDDICADIGHGFEK